MSALQPNASPFALVPQDAHEALLARGMMWEECECAEGEALAPIAEGSDRYWFVQCERCHGDGGRYVADTPALDSAANPSQTPP